MNDVVLELTEHPS